VYVHVPYCASRCHYCDFNTYRFDPREAEAYLRALDREITLYGDRDSLRRRPVCSIFVGGGTPSILSASQLASILDRLRATFLVEPDAEVSLEANPGTVDLAKLRALREGGVNRLSLGVQAAQDRLLQRIGREHTVAEAEEAFWLARRAGFAAINLDLMFGLPGQGLDEWLASLRWAVRLNPEHVSTYGLVLEEGTRLCRERDDGSLALPDEETEAAMYAMAIDLLEAAGFEQYEISNFARPGFRCRHNLVYWEHREYLGLGPGACSFLDGRRFYNERLPGVYVRAILARGTAVAGGESLTPDALRTERLMLGLRLRAGLDLRSAQDALGVQDLRASGRLAALSDSGLLQIAGGRLRLTERGLLVANEVILQVLEAAARDGGSGPARSRRG
jgi:oxygen-independent coproporphyrinogen-3 oxidase